MFTCICAPYIERNLFLIVSVCSHRMRKTTAWLYANFYFTKSALFVCQSAFRRSDFCIMWVMRLKMNTLIACLDRHS